MTIVAFVLTVKASHQNQKPTRRFIPGGGLELALKSDLAQMYPCQKNVIRVPDVVMGRLSDELVFWEVPNIMVQIYANRPLGFI